MPAMSHRRSAKAPGAASTESVSAQTAEQSGPAESNAALAQEVEAPSQSGPFGSPMLNAALEAAFGTSLAGLSARQDTEKNASLGARAVTEGREMSFGMGVDGDVNDLDFVKTAAHETAHALAGGGSGKTALDVEGDPGEAQAERAGEQFHAWAQTGFEGPAPDLTAATAGQASLHRDHVVGSWTGRPTLRIGSNGRQVRSLQTLLNAHGQRVSVDGAFGPRTRAAVMAFQRANGLVVDGIAGPATAGKLNASRGSNTGGGGSAPGPTAQVTGRPMLSFNSRGGMVSALQSLLNGKGARLTVDGVFGAGTRQAVTQFQRANGLGVDGVVGPATARKLNDPSSARIQQGAGQGQGNGRENYRGNEAYENMRDAVIAAAESHMGKRYYWGGDGPNVFDCSGFVLYVLRQNTGLIEWGDDTAAGIRNRVPAVNSPQKGDLVFYRGNSGVSHIEFAMGNGSQTIGASGGGSRTFGQDPNAKVQYGDWTRDRRRKSFGSIDGLIQAAMGGRR